MKEANISSVVEKSLCLGCGVCTNACPTKSISMETVNGQYIPFINRDSCLNDKGCSRCIKVCPGVGVDLKTISQKAFSNQISVEFDGLIGYWTNFYAGYSTDGETRLHGASGGLLTSFLAFLLDKKYISAAVITKNELSKPFLNETFLAHSSSDLKKGRSSKYCPVTFDRIVDDVKSEEGKVVIVGLPCHIQGFRKLESVDRGFKEKVFGYFGLLCSCGRTFNLTDFVFKEHGIDKNSLSYFQYRDNGCLGSLLAIDAKKKTEIPFQLYYHPLKSFFIPSRCLLCVDHYAELSDVAFGDIHYGAYLKDQIGVNSLIIRNSSFLPLLHEAEKEGYVYLEAIDKQTVLNCQKSAIKKKTRVVGAIHFAKMMGMAVPLYNADFKSYNVVKSAMYYVYARLQGFVGKRKKLWPLISLFKKKGTIR